MSWRVTLEATLDDPASDMFRLLANRTRTDGDVAPEWVIQHNQQQQNESDLPRQRSHHQALSPHIRYAEKVGERDRRDSSADQQNPHHCRNRVLTRIDAE